MCDASADVPCYIECVDVRLVWNPLSDAPLVDYIRGDDSLVLPGKARDSHLQHVQVPVL